VSLKFNPTPQQEKIIRHDRSAFVNACPGAGKTRIIVERAKVAKGAGRDGKGIAYLSFTRAAVAVLEERLRSENLLDYPAFPHFVGTFDSFIWQYIVLPFGLPDRDDVPRLVPDLNERTIRPFEKAQLLSLACFDRKTGKMDVRRAAKAGFDVSKKPASLIKAFETTAVKTRQRFYARGEIDFDDARDIAATRLSDLQFSAKLAKVLAARFKEIIVDEAQDCNPSDLGIIDWMRSADIPIKVICDPNQSIYEFRGGVTDQLLTFSDTFADDCRLIMNGNFRSTRNICKAIVMLRSASARMHLDEALGDFKDEEIPIYLFSYSGAGVPPSIGEMYTEVLSGAGIELSKAPLLAATKNSAYNAIGQPILKLKKDLTYKIAKAVKDFHNSFEPDDQNAALEAIHKVVLTIQDHLPAKSYHQYLYDNHINHSHWRPQALHILRYLKFGDETEKQWHARTKEVFAPFLQTDGGSIAQKIKANQDVALVLRHSPVAKLSPKTIHSVKGMEFPGVCVVTTSKTVKGILDSLQGLTDDPIKAEAARELYVAASRAQRLLAIAVPKSQCSRLSDHLKTHGADVKTVVI
jgi:DNA helicase-2/ATP-dependent DNA helicase PcrA